MNPGNSAFVWTAYFSLTLVLVLCHTVIAVQGGGSIKSASSSPDGFVMFQPSDNSGTLLFPFTWTQF
jgi:hypothetical protein